MVIVGRNSRVIDLLRRLGTEVFVSENNKNLQIPVQSHADMSVLHLGDNKFLTYDSAIAKTLKSMGADCAVPAVEQAADYPHDVALNCLVLGSFIVCNTLFCAPEIPLLAEKTGRKLINVRQGYARCSVAVVDEHSVITADKKIAAKLLGEGLDVLCISSGSIELPGYNCGFIGGCCGKISRDKLLFCGDPANHPDGERIYEFVNSKGIEIITTADEPLFDFGGIIQVFEQ